MRIPFMDLNRQYQSLKNEVDGAIQAVIDTSAFVGGPAKNNFEESFARACGAKHCIGVGNGTDALFIALKAMGIGQGDEVIVPAMTFIATAEAVSAIGAKPVFVDIDPQNYLMDVKQVEALLEARAHTRGGKIKALIPVHLYGRICPMKDLMDLAKKFDLFVLEDAAQAHLAEEEGLKAGAIGHMGTFSFYPGKNLGAFGDGGAIVTSDDDLALMARKLANHGRTKKYDHDVEGFNSRLDGIQAAVLNVKLPHLADWSEKRRKYAKRYNELLSAFEDKIALPHIPEVKQHVFHLYVVRVLEGAKKRKELQEKIKELGVSTVVHYPIALPNLQAYAPYGHKPSDFPVSSQYQDQVLSLPLFPEMTPEEQDHVVKCLHQVL